MTISFDLPIVNTKELELMKEFEGLTKEELLLKKKELEREAEDIQQDYVKVSDKYMKLRATKDAFLVVGCSQEEYESYDKKHPKSTGEEYLSLDMELQMAGRNMNSARERLELAKDELNAVDQAIAKRELDEYRQHAKENYQRFLELTDVKRVDDEGTFIFVSKKQLMAFWDRRSGYTGDSYCIYGMIDICDITEDDIKTASIVSDGKNFYRGIKEDYSGKAIEYWALDYSDFALGKFMKPIQKFAVNLKELLCGASCPVPTLFYEKREILRKLVETVPSSVSAIPYEILVDKDCFEIIEEALSSAIGKLHSAVVANESTMTLEMVNAFKEEQVEKLTKREKLATDKFKKKK